MKIKIILFLAFVVSNYFQSLGQERVNREKLSFEEKSEILTKAIGWSYNSVLGEWVDYENVISNDKDYKGEYKLLQGEWMMSKIDQNFLNIQTKTISFNNLKYYVLIVNKWNGAFEYPAIFEDWYTFKQTIGYIFTKDEFDKLRWIVLGLEKSVKVKTKYVVSIQSKYDETKFLDFIQSELPNEKGEYFPEYTFLVLKSKEGAIRFYLPTYFTTYSNFDFDENYFETDYKIFFKILIK